MVYYHRKTERADNPRNTLLKAFRNHGTSLKEVAKHYDIDVSTSDSQLKRRRLLKRSNIREYRKAISKHKNGVSVYQHKKDSKFI